MSLSSRAHFSSALFVISSELSQECRVVYHTYSPSEINAIQRVNTCSTFYIWHMWNCITLNFVTIDIQDKVIVKGMGKLSMPVVPGNLISLPNFLGMQPVQ